MGVIIDDSGGATVADFIARPTAVIEETKPLVTQHIKGDIVAKMAIEPAPRKSGDIGNGNGGTAPAADGQVIGPPDARITSGKMGLGAAILIGVAVLTLVVIMGGRRA